MPVSDLPLRDKWGTPCRLASMQTGSRRQWRAPLQLARTAPEHEALCEPIPKSDFTIARRRSRYTRTAMCDATKRTAGHCSLTAAPVVVVNSMVVLASSGHRYSFCAHNTDENPQQRHDPRTQMIRVAQARAPLHVRMHAGRTVSGCFRRACLLQVAWHPDLHHPPEGVLYPRPPASPALLPWVGARQSGQHRDCSRFENYIDRQKAPPRAVWQPKSCDMSPDGVVSFSDVGRPNYYFNQNLCCVFSNVFGVAGLFLTG